MTQIITPRKLPGFWELDPQKEVVFEDMLQKIKSVFIRHAFLPLDTPVMELSQVLLAKSGGDIDKEIYRIIKGSTDACLRYDFTVPLARFVAANAETLSFPFKRFQIGKNYRGERPQKGRFREFYQCDADIIGDGALSLVNDAECVALYIDIFKELNLNGVVEVSNRKVLFGLCKFLGEEDNFSQISIILDKMDKIGEDECRNMLVELGVKNVQPLLDLVKVKGDREAIIALKDMCDEAVFIEGVEELLKIDEFLKAMGQDKYVFNLGIIRGHNYYTGTVFEAYLNGLENCGAVGGGGRYENLAGYFSHKSLPGVGMSIGMSRLFDVLDNNNMLPEIKGAAKVAVIPFEGALTFAIKAVKKLQDAGIASEVYGEEKSFKSKMKDANRRDAEFVILIGEDEINSGLLSFKDMKTSQQQKLTIEEIINFLR